VCRGDLVALGKHALLVGVVVAPLHFKSRSLGDRCGQDRACQETGPGTDGGARPGRPGSGPDQRPGRGPQRTPTDGTGRDVLVDRIVGIPTGLVLRPSAARGVVHLEGLEALAAARHHQHTRPGGHGRAPAETNEHGTHRDPTHRFH
jgi:hypothetical protein